MSVIEHQDYISTMHISGDTFFRAQKAVNSETVVIPGQFYAGHHPASKKWLIGAVVEIRGEAQSTAAAKKSKTITAAKSATGWVCLALFKGRHAVDYPKDLTRIITTLGITPIPDDGAREIFGTGYWEWVPLDTIRGPLTNILLQSPNQPPDDNTPPGSLVCRYVINDSTVGVQMWPVFQSNGAPAFPNQIYDEACAPLSGWKSPNGVLPTIHNLDDDEVLHPDTPAVVEKTLNQKKKKKVVANGEAMRMGESYSYVPWIQCLTEEDKAMEGDVTPEPDPAQGGGSGATQVRGAEGSTPPL
ncbi:hypothetical protein BD779DRAFT_1479088 [Infundibulicybe gibba]|nr:hypothetical protein BD779DRAFT_1479088 [Infundibulicybe gibba]